MLQLLKDVDKLSNNAPIGVFDSGLGGLTVWREVRRALPAESLVYLGDGKNCPYGSRPREEVRRLADEAVAFLVAQGCKLVVVACNTATAAAIDFLREKYAPMPIVGMEPAVKPACLATRSGVVGVLATERSLDGELFRRTAARYGDGVDLVTAPGRGFVELVENDLEATPEAEATVRAAVAEMLEHGADQIVLGCTHYPIVEENFHECYPEMHLINPALEQANAVKAYLTEQNALNPQKKGKFVICTSGDPQVYVNVGKRLGLFEASELKVVHI